MKKINPTELKKGKVYENSEGFWEFIEERNGNFIFLEVRIIEDEFGNVMDWNAYKEFGSEIKFKEKELYFYEI